MSKTARSHADRLVFAAFVGLLFFLPLPWGSNRNWIWLLEAAAALSLLLVVLWLPRQEKTLARYAPDRPIFVALALWWAYGVVQIIPLPFGWGPISIDPFASALMVLQTSFYVSLFLLVLALARTPSRMRTIARALVIAGLMQAMYGAMMTLSGVEWLVLERKTYSLGLATGTFVNRNHLAGFLELALACGIGLLVAQMRSGSRAGGFRSRLRDLLGWIVSGKMALRLALVAMVIALVLTHSRMGNTAFFVSLLVASGAALALMKNPPRPLVWLLVSLLAIDVLLVGAWFGVDQVVDRLVETGRYDAIAQRYGDADRLDLSTETLGVWRDYPLTGSGGGTFQHLFPAYRPADLAKVFQHAHNDYLELLLEYGVLGILPLAAFVLLCFNAALRSQRERRNPLMRGTGFATTMAIVAMALHSTVDFNLHIPANAGWMMVLLALGIASRRVPSV